MLLPAGPLRPLLLALLLLLLAAAARGLPPAVRAPAADFVGEATDELATLLLQANVDSNKNLAFSPLGYSALLAILAEGAAGETRRQLEAALHLPADRQLVRDTYRGVLERLREKHVMNKPELRNWFYVYKNHTVEAAYREVLREHYLTDVKAVSRPVEDMGFQEGDQAALPEPHPHPQPQPQPQPEQAEEAQSAGAAIEDAQALGAVKESALIESALQHEAMKLGEHPALLEQSQKPDEQKLAPEPAADQAPLKGEEEAAEQKPLLVAVEGKPQEMIDEDEKKDKLESGIIAEMHKPIGEITQEPAQDDQTIVHDIEQLSQDQAPGNDFLSQESASDASKDAENPMEVGDLVAGSEQQQQQQQQQHENQEEQKQQQEQQQEQQKEQQQEQQQDHEQDHQQEQQQQQQQQQLQQEQIDEQEQEQEDGELMLASERRVRRHVHELDIKDITSGLSGNTLGSRSVNGSRMLVFNGMYFRGSWRTPFVPAPEPEAFYLSENSKVQVHMMRALDSFRVGSVPELDSVALELPYEGDRYSLLVLLPNSRSGLNGLVADLAGYSLRHVYASMASQEVEVTLPCFSIETITRPIPAFSKFGVSDPFSADKADLTGISAAGGLYVQDLVQLVTVRVDNSSSSLNHLTSSALQSRTGHPEKFTADHPFLYFVRDTIDNLVVVAGRVVDPTDRPTDYP